MNATLLCGDARAVLRRLPQCIFRVCVTSPPYYGLRDYQIPPLVWGGDPVCPHQWGNATGGFHPGQVEQTKWKSANAAGNGGNAERAAFCVCCGAWRGSLGLEPTPTLYVTHLVEVLEHVKRVLADDGTLWLNLGDSYCTRAALRDDGMRTVIKEYAGERLLPSFAASAAQGKTRYSSHLKASGLKDKDLIGIPWMVAFALRDAGWYLRSDIIWAKGASGQKAMAQQVADAARDCGIAEAQITCLLENLDLYVGNPMPESVTDRPTRAHEYVFLLSKSERYFYDKDAIAEPLTRPDEADRITPGRFGGAEKYNGYGTRLHSGNEYRGTPNGTRNHRSVWTIPTKSFRGAHFAVMAQALVEPCILAGSEPGDLILDPFCGSGTTGVVALQHERGFVGIDLNEKYLDLARMRLEQGK